MQIVTRRSRGYFRRHQKEDFTKPLPILISGNLVLDMRDWLVRVDGREVHFSRAEIFTLKSLLENVGVLLSKKDLIKMTRRPPNTSEDAIKMSVSRIRATLEVAGWTGTITTVRGCGFRLEKAE